MQSGAGVVPELDPGEWAVGLAASMDMLTRLKRILTEEAKKRK